MAAVGDALPVTGAERDCVAAKLSADQALVARLAGQPDAKALTGFVQQCKQASFAELFVDSVFQSHGGQLTPVQQQCLRDAFVRLSPADLDAMVGAATSPTDSASAKGRESMDRLLSGCGVQP